MHFNILQAAIEEVCHADRGEGSEVDGHDVFSLVRLRSLGIADYSERFANCLLVMVISRSLPRGLALCIGPRSDAAPPRSARAALLADGRLGASVFGWEPRHPERWLPELRRPAAGRPQWRAGQPPALQPSPPPSGPRDRATAPRSRRRRGPSALRGHSDLLGTGAQPG